MAELFEWEAQTLSQALTARTLSAVEVMAAALDRIGAVNPAANAIVALRDRDALLAEARAADAGPVRGPLHGMPFAVKDLSDVSGLPTSHGSPLYADAVAAEDSGMAARLRAAGAIFIGKTNVPEFGLGSHTVNPVYGATRNAYDPARTAGGSSGGAAVALAARMLWLADGTDAMGSLRNPAGWANIYSLRPSWGLVPGEVGAETYLHALSTAGPMARSPADLALLLGVMAAREPRRPFGRVVSDLPAPGDLVEPGPAAPARVGWLADWGGAYPMAPGILETCLGALRAMEGLGWTVEDIAPPVPAEMLWDSWTVLRHFEKAASHGADYADPDRRAQLKVDMIWEIEGGLGLSAMDVQAASALRSDWLVRAVEVFEMYDVLALPTAQVWPFPLEGAWPWEVAGRRMDTYHRWMEVVVPASLLGLPVLTVPAGFGTPGEPGAGMPMGLQLIGRPGADGALLRLGAAYHAATQWPAHRPAPVSGLGGSTGA